MPGLSLTRRVGEAVLVGPHRVEVAATDGGAALLVVTGPDVMRSWRRPGEAPLRVGEAFVLVQSVGSRSVRLSIVAPRHVAIAREEVV